MDLDGQEEIPRASRDHGDDVVILLGSPDAESTSIFAETVTIGDPTYAGPLAGVSLRLPVYHIFEPEIKEQVDAAVYREQVGVVEMALDGAAIIAEAAKARSQVRGG